MVRERCPPLPCLLSAGGAPVCAGGGGGRVVALGPGDLLGESRAGEQRGRGGAAHPPSRGLQESRRGVGGENRLAETPHHGNQRPSTDDASLSLTDVELVSLWRRFSVSMVCLKSPNDVDNKYRY